MVPDIQTQALSSTVPDGRLDWWRGGVYIQNGPQSRRPGGAANGGFIAVVPILLKVFRLRGQASSFHLFIREECLRNGRAHDDR